jgi:hypothetical protein
MTVIERIQRWIASGTGRWGLGLGVVLALVAGIGAAAIRSGTPLEVGSDRVGESDAAAAHATAGPPMAAVLEADSAVAAALAEEPEGSSGAAAADAADAVRSPVAEPVEWVSARTPSPVEPVGRERRVLKPESVRGIYVGSWPVGSARRFDQLLGFADRTEVNAFVIDVKDVTGEVSYASQVPLARQVGATERVRIADVRERLDRLRERGIYPIARIVVFKDPLLASARPEWSIQREDGSVWEDNKGVHWVDAYNRDVWDYNIELAREAIALGFSEIQWDYVRFPDAPNAYMREAVYPARAGRSRTEGIRAFMMHANDRLAELDVPITADVFGITTSAFNDVGIGQLWEEMSDVVDVLLPMVYPSHYPRGSWSYPNPNAAPYQIVRKAMEHGVNRSAEIENAAGIRPWLQAFSLGEPDYGPRHVRAQIDAVYDAGLTEWILWNPAVRYDPESLVTASGDEPWFAGMGAELYQPPEAGLDGADADAGAAVDSVRTKPLGAPVSGG